MSVPLIFVKVATPILSVAASLMIVMLLMQVMLVWLTFLLKPGPNSRPLEAMSDVKVPLLISGTTPSYRGKSRSILVIGMLLMRHAGAGWFLLLGPTVGHDSRVAAQPCLRGAAHLVVDGRFIW
jgi:hypothetical protein